MMGIAAVISNRSVMARAFNKQWATDPHSFYLNQECFEGKSAPRVAMRGIDSVAWRGMAWRDTGRSYLGSKHELDVFPSRRCSIAT